MIMRKNNTTLFVIVLLASSCIPIRLPGNVTLIELFILFCGAAIPSLNSFKIKVDPIILKLLLLFSLSTFISVPLAFEPMEAAKVSIRWFEMFLLFVCISVIFRQSDEATNKLIFTLIATSVVVHSLLNDGVSIMETFRIRIGVFILVPFAYLLARYDQTRGGAILIIIMLVLLYMTQSRAVWLGVLIFFIVFMYRGDAKIRIIGCLLGVIAILFLMNDAMFLARLGQLNINSENAAYSTFQRLYRVAVTIFAVGDFPVTGVGGNGLYSYTMSREMPLLDAWKQWLVANDKSSINPHNILLQVSAEHGVVSALFLVLIVARVFQNALRKSDDVYYILCALTFMLFLLTGYVSETKRLFFVALLWVVSIKYEKNSYITLR